MEVFYENKVLASIASTHDISAGIGGSASQLGTVTKVKQALCLIKLNTV